MAIPTLTTLIAYVSTVSEYGWTKDFLIVGMAPRRSASITNINEKVGSLTINQKYIAIKANNRVIQSEKTISFFPLTNPNIIITAQINTITPLNHAPGPAPFEICIKNPIPVNNNHISQEKA